jgi:nucleotide-binding universal stress UspA family protein
MPLRTIVAGVDEAPGARDAAALAAALGEACGAEVLLVVVCPELLPLPDALREQGRRKAAELVERVRDEVAHAARTEVAHAASPAKALRRAAAEAGADLLVLGSASGTPEGGARSGRTARQVMGDAPCPVAVAAAGLRAKASAPRSIVVGVNEHAESVEALRFAHDLAAATGARLKAVAVAEEMLPVSPIPLATVIEVARWDKIVADRRAALERRLEALLADHPETEREVRVGDPVEELAAAAADADLLIVGSRHWGPLDRVSLGTTSEALVGGAPCSLVVVPRPADGDPAGRDG